jgi:hypothetical protein
MTDSRRKSETASGEDTVVVNVVLAPGKSANVP